jgi:hypothetical protein
VVDTKQPDVKAPAKLDFTADRLSTDGSRSGTPANAHFITATDLGEDVAVTCANEAIGIPPFVNAMDTTFFAPTGKYALTCTATDGRTTPVVTTVEVRGKAGLGSGTGCPTALLEWVGKASSGRAPLHWPCAFRVLMEPGITQLASSSTTRL